MYDALIYTPDIFLSLSLKLFSSIPIVREEKSLIEK